MTTLTDDLVDILQVHSYGTGGICLNAQDGYRTGCGWTANRRNDKTGALRAGRLDEQHRRHVAACIADAVEDAITGAVVHAEEVLRREHRRPPEHSPIKSDQHQEVLFP